MTAISCPHCGETMNLSLKICVSCGRAISTAEIKKLGAMKSNMKGGVTKKLDDNISVSSFDRSKKSYRVQRGFRQLLLTTSYILLACLLYYFAVKFILKEALPFNADAMLQNFFGQNTPQEGSGTAPGVLDEQAPPPGDQPSTSKVKTPKNSAKPH